MQISYEPFWKTIEEKGMNQYILINKLGVRSSLIHKLRHNLDVRVSTLLDLCEILDCHLNDIVEAVKETDEI